MTDDHFTNIPYPDRIRSLRDASPDSPLQWGLVPRLRLTSLAECAVALDQLRNVFKYDRDERPDPATSADVPAQ